MKTFLKALISTLLLSQAANAIDISTEQYECAGMVRQDEPINWVREGSIVENRVIVVPPNTDIAMRITKPNVTVRNVVIFHPANGKGIFGWKANGLTIENVEIISYGNEWGAQPCPTRAPLNGYRCSNIEIYKTTNLRIENVRAENGSKGINIIDSPGAIIN